MRCVRSDCGARVPALAGVGTAGEGYKERWREELGVVVVVVAVVVVVGPWTPRPGGGAGQPLLASLLRIDFCCSALPWRLLAGGDGSPAHPHHLPLSWLGWPSLPTTLQLRLAPCGALRHPRTQHGGVVGGTGERQPESPWQSTAVFTCSGFTRLEAPP